MPTIIEKMPTVNGSDAYNIENEILSLSAVLHQKDGVAHVGLVTKLAKELSIDDQEELKDTLRNPHLAIGIFKDDPLWLEVEQAIERNRQRDREESAAE